MFGLEGIWLYLAIFIGEMIYLVIDTLYVMSMGNGKGYVTAGLGFVKIVFWVCVTGSIITNITSDPMKIVVYCCGHALGLLIGMTIEKRLAIGLTSLYVLCGSEDTRKIARELHDRQFGVTILEGHSTDGTKREIILVHLLRRRTQEAVGLVRGIAPNAFVSTGRLSAVSGGYLR